MKEQTEQSNKLIAEFMGWTTHKGFIEEWCDSRGFYEGTLSASSWKTWDKLMPVIDKLSKQCEEPEEMDNLKYALLSADIETAYSEVVNLIENTQVQVERGITLGEIEDFKNLNK